MSIAPHLDGLQVPHVGQSAGLLPSRSRPADDREAERPASRATARGAPRVAIVHDFLYTLGGAEAVLAQMLKVFPDADLFSLFDFLPDEHRGFLAGKPVTTSFIQRLPGARNHHRGFLPLMPIAIEQLDLTGYDIILSSSYCAAKGVITRPNQLHICYCHSPVRFAWDLQKQYLEESGMVRGVKSMLVRTLLHYIRIWDSRSANGVDVFLSNSRFIARRIDKTYRRRATTIYPPVDVDEFAAGTVQEDFYITASRLVQYKRVDLLIDAFRKMPTRSLVIIGGGPEEKKLRAMAPKNVQVLGYQPRERLVELMGRARAFVYAAEEDFGIVAVEAQACGTPVLAYGSGGLTESIVDGRTGLFFSRQTVTDVVDCVERFERHGTWDRDVIRANAGRFSIEHFRGRLRDIVDAEWDQFRRRVDHTDDEADEWPRTSKGTMRPASDAPVEERAPPTFSELALASLDRERDS